METLQITILNPKARQLLDDLAALNVIAVQPQTERLLQFVAEIQKRGEMYPVSEEEITEEVEIVRAEMYAEQQKNKNCG